MLALPLPDGTESLTLHIREPHLEALGSMHTRGYATEGERARQGLRRAVVDVDVDKLAEDVSSPLPAPRTRMR